MARKYWVMNTPAPVFSYRLLVLNILSLSNYLLTDFIWRIVGLDIYFLASISGASMNPARSLAPAILSGSVGDLWLYWSATFIGTSLVALLLRRKIVVNE